MSDLLSIVDAIETETEAARLIQLAVKGATMDADDKELIISALESHLIKLEEVGETAQAAMDEARGFSMATAA